MTREEILRALEQEPCEKCCNGNQEEKAKLCQKSYIAGMEHNCENEEIIKVSKGVLKARQGRFVIYDVEWLKTHFSTTEAKIYGQPSEDWNAVLDKIKAEIEQAFLDDKAMQEHTVKKCLGIIDKYKGERKG